MSPGSLVVAMRENCAWASCPAWIACFNSMPFLIQYRETLLVIWFEQVGTDYTHVATRRGDPP